MNAKKLWAVGEEEKDDVGDVQPASTPLRMTKNPNGVQMGGGLESARSITVDDVEV